MACQSTEETSEAISWCNKDNAINLEAKKLTQVNLDDKGIPSDYLYTGKWISTKMWALLKTRFTAQNSSKMWTTLKLYEQLSAMNCKNIEELQRKVARIQADIDEQKVTMKEALVMKVIQHPRPDFHHIRYHP